MLFAAVCYNTAWQPPASFSLPPPGPRPCDMATRHSRFDHTVPAVPSVTRLFQVCILLAHAMPPLFPPLPLPRVSFLPLPHSSVWQTPSLNSLLRLRSSVTSSMRPSLTPFPRKSRLPCSWESATGLCIATPYVGILSQSMKHEAMDMQCGWHCLLGLGQCPLTSVYRARSTVLNSMLLKSMWVYAKSLQLCLTL